jgi:small subunit ribosomal protein S20
LANTASALREIHKNQRRRVRNRIVRSSARTELKTAARLIESGDLTKAEQAAREAIRALDQAAQKGVIKKNNAARRKARLMKKLNNLHRNRNGVVNAAK